MTRTQKYKDTNTFHYYNANPKNRITGDCLIRALSVGMGKPYNEVVMELAKLQCETGYDSYQLIDRYLKANGWEKQHQPRKWDDTKYTASEFCEEIVQKDDFKKRFQHIIANVGSHHIVAIVKGKVWDIWNSTGERVGNYWTKI